MSLKRAIENAIKIYENENPDNTDELLLLIEDDNGRSVAKKNLSGPKAIFLLELAKAAILKKITDSVEM